MPRPRTDSTDPAVIRRREYRERKRLGLGVVMIGPERLNVHKDDAATLYAEARKMQRERLEQEMEAPVKVIRRKTMVELKSAIYEANGWRRKAGESMSARIKPLYDICIDHSRGELVATQKPFA